MTAKSRIPLITFGAGNVAAGTTKGTPVASAWKDLTAIAGCDLSWRFVNGASAPGVAPVLVVQTSPDNGATVYNFATIGGDIVANSDNSDTLWLDQGLMYVRVIAYGNTVNAVGVGVDIQAVTG